MDEDDLTFQEWLNEDGNLYIAAQLKKYSEDKDVKESLWCHRRLSYKLYEKKITPEQYLEQYEKFVRKRLWCKLDSLEGKTLGCWCKEQEKCHGTVLIKLFNEKQKIIPF